MYVGGPEAPSPSVWGPKLTHGLFCSTPGTGIRAPKRGRLFLSILGSKLRALMKNNGMNFAQVEMELKRTSSKAFEEKRSGSWVTKHFLVNNCHWTKTNS